MSKKELIFEIRKTDKIYFVLKLHNVDKIFFRWEYLEDFNIIFIILNVFLNIYNCIVFKTISMNCHVVIQGYKHNNE